VIGLSGRPQYLGIPAGLFRCVGFFIVPSHKFRHQFKRIGAEGPSDRDEFHDIEPAHATLIFGDKRLWPLQSEGKGLLGHPRSLAGPNHEPAEGCLVGRMDGFADACGARCHQQGKLIPSSDYPKKGYY
jgi:hypothetical protein